MPTDEFYTLWSAWVHAESKMPKYKASREGKKKYSKQEIVELIKSGNLDLEKDLIGVDLSPEEGFERAILRYADLQGADLQGAYLYRAYLYRADLRGARLKGAYLDCVDLKGIIH